MDGEPVWLCSVSKCDLDGKTKATGTWVQGEFELAARLAHDALKGVGDRRRERAFRMNITFCIHRAVSEEEKKHLPKEWASAPGWLAGGPIEALWSKGIPHKPASMPCVSPGKIVMDKSRPDLWFPEDCGKCEPCKARAAIAAKVKEAAHA